MKEIINKIIQDLGDDKPIKGILLKAQIVASKLGNNDFEMWIRNEQNGYPDAENLPDYRILNAIVKANVSQPFVGMYQNIIIPQGIFDNAIINDCMSHVCIVHSLNEIENIGSSQKTGNVSINSPSMAYTEVNKYVSGNVEKVWQEFSVSSLVCIVDKFKSKLLSFFLDLDEKIDAGIDFSKIEGQKVISNIMNNYYINSVVANIGDGNVNTGNISDSDLTLYISDQDQKEKLQSVISQLVEKASDIDNSDLKMAIDTIKEECNKPSWGKKTLKLALNAIQGIATGIAANQLTPIVTQALALL